ncbi:hypothetical protein M0P48_00525 [Candidatus Gracilibacteria bacterium]|nr:hypothetical protein [Candidatus Gracilibacteria bacterium]
MNKSERVEYNRVNLKENEGTPNEKTYRLTWVSYPHLLEQMPLLRGRTVATLTPVFKCLEEWGFIKTAVWKGKGRKYVGLLEKTHILYKKHEDKEKEEEKQEEEEKEGEQGETV